MKIINFNAVFPDAASCIARFKAQRNAADEQKDKPLKCGAGSHNRTKVAVITMACLLITGIIHAQKDDLKNFPPGSTAREIGQKIARHYISGGFRNFSGRTTPPAELVYPETCTWFGALRFAQASNDKNILRKLEERFLPLLGCQKELMQVPDHVDHTVFGVIPLQLYIQTGNEAYYFIGIDFADRQWQIPGNSKKLTEYHRLLDNGLSWQTRFWIDDMFMITTVQSQAYLASGNEKYINRAAYEMTVYLDSIQQPNGLFYHASTAPFYWCRGNGWMAAGMADILQYLPAKSSYRERILTEYRKMMNTLKNYCKEDGLWGQLIDDTSSWTETSGSAMFTYAMIVGIRKGWLDACEYVPVVRKAWLSLLAYINENNELMNVCTGTNTGTTKQYYLDRERVTGDLHGQAPLLWCAAELLK